MTLTKMTALVALLSIVAYPALSAEEVRTYRACIELVGVDPARALEAAEAWQKIEPKPGADHCIALALVAQGEFGRAARRLEAMAATRVQVSADKENEWRITEPRRVDLLAQAGNAWLLAEKPESAHALFSSILSRPDVNGGARGELLIDRARALAMIDDMRGAIADLDSAIVLLGYRADILTFRASARRSLGLFADALEDADRALKMVPNDADALFERGNVRYDMGDRDGARADWTRVGEVAPGSPTADAAERNRNASEGRPTSSGSELPTPQEPQGQAPAQDASGAAQQPSQAPIDPAPTQP